MKPILVVDDEAIVRDSISDWLKDVGYDVQTAESGEQALEMVRRQDFSVIVLDVRLPGKSGLEVLREAKAIKPQIKSIMITAYPSAAGEAEAKKQGALDYLTKPIFPAELEKLIRETLAKWEVQA
jgi:CheY-like chemotaxis protein